MNKKQQIITWVLIIAGLGAIILGMIGAASQKQQSSELANLAKPVSSNDHIRGNISAKAILVEFSDFQCPACGYYYGMVKKLEQDFPGTLAVVYRNFPLTQVHKYALLSAEAAEAAGKQGKFWEMHDMLFENQNEWPTSDNALQLFVSYAKNLGLNQDKFMSDINGKALADKISNDISDGNNQGIIGTPTFFLNGKQIENPSSYDEFKSLVEKEINK